MLQATQSEGLHNHFNELWVRIFGSHPRISFQIWLLNTMKEIGGGWGWIRLVQVQGCRLMAWYLTAFLIKHFTPNSYSIRLCHAKQLVASDLSLCSNLSVCLSLLLVYEAGHISFENKVCTVQLPKFSSLIILYWTHSCPSLWPGLYHTIGIITMSSRHCPKSDDKRCEESGASQ